MRIAHVSTYPPIECGIATYCKYLSDALKNLGKEVRIISQIGAKGDYAFEAYAPYDKDIASKLYHIAEILTPDVVHIQHEFGLFGDQRGIQIVEFLLRCKASNTPIVTTLHTIYKDLKKVEKIILQHILNESAAIIVHEDFQRDILLKNYKISVPIEIIPHGVRSVTRIKDAKTTLEIEDKKVILLAGYVRSTKNFEQIINIFPEILSREPDALLLIATRNRINEYSDYQHKIYQLIEQSPAKDHIMVLDGKFPQLTFDTILSAADIMAMSYNKSAQSGILAQASAFKIPVVVSDLPSFSKWVQEVNGGFVAHSDDEYINYICKLLGNENLRKNMQLNIQQNNIKKSWEANAKKHLEIYESVVKSPYPKAQFFYVDETKKTKPKDTKESELLIH